LLVSIFETVIENANRDGRKTDRTIRIPISVLYKLGIKLCGVFLKGKMYYLCGKEKGPKERNIKQIQPQITEYDSEECPPKKNPYDFCRISACESGREAEEEERARMHCSLHTPFPLSRGIPTWSFTWKKTARRMGERQISNKM